MVGWITHGAYRLDLWLRRRLGRPYGVLLIIGLVIEIARGALALPEHLAARPRLIGRGLVLLMELALLIHQVGALSHHLGPRRVKNEGGEAPCPPEGEGAEADGETREIRLPA